MSQLERLEASWEANKLNQHLAENDEYDYFIMWCEENDLDPELTDISEFQEYVEDMKAEWIIGRREMEKEDPYYDTY
jgi:hypothetical protein